MTLLSSVFFLHFENMLRPPNLLYINYAMVAITPSRVTLLLPTSRPSITLYAQELYKITIKKAKESDL
ncbi:hypothetical protein GCM10008013_15590 [Paenibacillus segetis]|uniref:Uncharacterized protein n=1 Tax=Paenibacillus segetis TaxID=1325360 RepID=A0ABQ1YAS0_9BACL|nr:hypothetical protein GCM10008013_15590 [Paenibacillus segetis]